MKQAWRAVFFVAALLWCIQLGAQSPLAESSAPQVAESATITIPAGTKVLMTSLAALNTISANNESGLYLETISDVVEQNRVVIPAGSHVQGSVIRSARPGRVKGRAELQFRFETLI